MNSSDLTYMLLLLAGMLLCALFMGGLFRKLKLPAITGEILVGVLLGPFIRDELFHLPSVNSCLAGFNTIAVIFLLMLSGTEVTFSDAIKHRKISLLVSSFGIIIPFALGFSFLLFFPAAVPGVNGIDPFITQLFFATAMSISALPVIAKTLMDLNLLKTDVGIVTMTSAVFDDLWGWMIFATVLAMAKSAGESFALKPLVLTLAFTVVMLSAVRIAVNKVLPYFAQWSGRGLAFCICFTLLSAALTEWIGVHALFGAFIAGVVIGDSKNFTPASQNAVEEFVLSFFAPLFMAMIGLKVDFIHHFDFKLTAIVIVIACLGKIVGCGIAAHLSGMSPKKSWAIGFAMNARGAMEIILGSIAFQSGIITETLFVSLVVMALFTSLMTGPILTKVLRTPS